MLLNISNTTEMLSLTTVLNHSIIARSMEAEDFINLFMIYVFIFGSLFLLAAMVDRNRKSKIDSLVNQDGGYLKKIVVKVTTKRNYFEHRYTRYYITFENILTNERLEFEVSGANFGLIAEGDKGTLSYQDNKFIKFERMVENANNVEDVK